MSEEDLFETYHIKFTDREAFDEAEKMNNLAIDVSHSEMILIYDNKFFRDRFAGFLAANGLGVAE